MADDEGLEKERQRLFAMVWERPASEVAKELGISDVALGKQCRRLQVPKPPRGYWARVASGQIPRRPPLPAYRAGVAERYRRSIQSSAQVRLSALQMEFVRFALQELEAVGVSTVACQLGYDGIRGVTPELAAQILILLQSRYEKWLADRTTAKSFNGALSSLSNLVDKLQPHAQSQILVFHRKSDDRYSRSNEPSISVRATTDFLEQLVQLSRLARKHGLAYAAADMSSLEHAWSVKQIYSPRAYSGAKTEMCVSSHEVWIRADVDNGWGRDRFETVRLPLNEICPAELLQPEERVLPPKIRRPRVKPYADRLQALKEAEAILETLSSAAYDMDRAIPDERLALFDRLWFGQGDKAPLTAARVAWRRMESDLERWEQELELESATLCRDVLGIETGDIVLVQVDGKPVRVTVEGMHVHTFDKEVMFSLWGRRFRKDGLPGKRSESFYITVENDLEPGEKGR